MSTSKARRRPICRPVGWPMICTQGFSMARMMRLVCVSSSRANFEWTEADDKVEFFQQLVGKIETPVPENVHLASRPAGESRRNPR